MPIAIVYGTTRHGVGFFRFFRQFVTDLVKCVIAVSADVYVSINVFGLPDFMPIPFSTNKFCPKFTVELKN